MAAKIRIRRFPLEAITKTEDMTAYIFRRLALMIPTLFGIMLISFIIIQFAPGGPIERIIAQLNGTNVDATARIGGSSDGRLLAHGPARARTRA